VDEDWPLIPARKEAFRRVAAENRLRDWIDNRVILRVPVSTDREGCRCSASETAPVVCEEESPWSNRHPADDLAQACFLAARRAGQGDLQLSVMESIDDDGLFPSGGPIYWSAPSPGHFHGARRDAYSSRHVLSFLEESKRLDNPKNAGGVGVIFLYRSCQRIAVLPGIRKSVSPSRARPRP